MTFSAHALSPCTRVSAWLRTKPYRRPSAPRRGVGRAPFVTLGMVVWAALSLAFAEMSGEEYASKAVLGRGVEATRRIAEIERERALAAEAEREQQRQAEQRRAALEAAETQRPREERLLTARCTSCHGLVVLEGVPRTALGWRLTVERMRWWHGAPVSADEASTIARYLAETRPGPWGAIDFAVTGVLAILGAACVSTLRALKRRARG